MSSEILTTYHETIAKIKEVNQRLSDLVGLPYTDFYRPERFVALFELAINPSVTGFVSQSAIDICTISDLVICLGEDTVINRITFLECLCNLIEDKLNLYENGWNKVIRAIKREFKGLGG